MKVLVAEDDQATRFLLAHLVQRQGYEVKAVPNGTAAWEILKAGDAPPLVLLDWEMPGLEGVEICRKVREAESPRRPYLIILTARGSTEDIVEALRSGADDYVTKPFAEEELLARIQVGERMVSLQAELRQRVEQLEEALSHVQRLQGLLPMCSYCRRIRDDQNYWSQVEEYVMKYSEASFTHGICPDCYETFVRPELEELRRDTGGQSEKPRS